MTVVHGPEGVIFPDDKPAKLRFFLGYVDDLAPAREDGSEQVSSVFLVFSQALFGGSFFGTFIFIIVTVSICQHS